MERLLAALEAARAELQAELERARQELEAARLERQTLRETLREQGIAHFAEVAVAEAALEELKKFLEAGRPVAVDLDAVAAEVAALRREKEEAWASQTGALRAEVAARLQAAEENLRRLETIAVAVGLNKADGDEPEAKGAKGGDKGPQGPTPPKAPKAKGNNKPAHRPSGPRDRGPVDNRLAVKSAQPAPQKARLSAVTQKLLRSRDWLRQHAEELAEEILPGQWVEAWNELTRTGQLDQLDPLAVRLLGQGVPGSARAQIARSLDAEFRVRFARFASIAQAMEEWAWARPGLVNG